MSDILYGSIKFTASNPSGSKYSVIPQRANLPANYVSWYDAIRFANWMNNGQGNGDTETGAYTLGTLGAGGVPVSPPLTHNVGSRIWLPTENEWYKAAYYNPGTGSYFLYPTSSNATPIASFPTGLPNHANYDQKVNGLTGVGDYTGTKSPYGAFDMGGNVGQWNEALGINSNRVYRGGSFAFNASFLRSLGWPSALPSATSAVIGFRLASVPEPSTLALAAFGFIGLAAWCWRRKRA